MCGRLNITDDPFVRQLIKELGVTSPLDKVHWGRFKRATDTLSIIREHQGKRELIDATWWLLLDTDEEGFKPSKFTSFNTRYDKLNVAKSAGYTAFRQSRCIIPVKGFGETEFKDKQPLHYHDFIAEDGALALAGLYRQWTHLATGEIKWSCSVITLPPHNKLAAYHSKSMPMILSARKGVRAQWLSEKVTDVSCFDNWLVPYLPQALLGQEIDKPSSHRCIGEPFHIVAD